MPGHQFIARPVLLAFACHPRGFNEVQHGYKRKPELWGPDSVSFYLFSGAFSYSRAMARLKSDVRVAALTGIRHTLRGQYVSSLDMAKQKIPSSSTSIPELPISVVSLV